MLFMGKSTINEPFSIVFYLVTRPGIHLKEIFTFAQVGCFSLKIVFILQDILEDFWRNLLIPVESWGFTNRFEKKNLRFKIVPGLVNCYITNWKDPPYFQWVNQLFRLGHFPIANCFMVILHVIVSIVSLKESVGLCWAACPCWKWPGIKLGVEGVLDCFLLVLHPTLLSFLDVKHGCFLDVTLMFLCYPLVN